MNQCKTNAQNTEGTTPCCGSYRRTIILFLAGVGIVAATMLVRAKQDGQANGIHSNVTSQESSIVYVKVFNAQGQLVGPVPSKKVQKDDAQWQKQLTSEQFRITRKQGTEPAFTGTLLKNKQEGVYSCVACGLPLYTQKTKFDSGTGWPSFYEAVAKENVGETRDSSLGVVRTEIHCARCQAHLGHVFDDGPKPTGQRHCVNSASLAFTPTDDIASKLSDPVANAPKLASAVFGGGCFWCTEVVFEQLAGVDKVISGYAGGQEKNANYQAVSAGATDHAEVIEVTYDPSRISYEKLLDVFFTVAHDPTQRDGQGNDHGRQYRSVVFFADGQQKQATEQYVAQLEKSKHFDKPIVTTVEPLTRFYPAEKYHQDYARLNPDQPYVRAVALPKVVKVRKKFAEDVR